MLLRRSFLFLLFLVGTTSFSLAQTTILSGTTISASTITVGNTITIQENGTLDMDVSRSFASITTSTTGVGNCTINGTGVLTITGAVTITGTTTLVLDVTATAATLATSNQTNTTATLNGSGELTLSTAVNINGTAGNQTTLLMGPSVTVNTAAINANNGDAATTTNLIVNGTLTVSGAIETGTTGVEVFTCNAGSIVDYNGAAQTIFGTTYANLIFSGSGIKTHSVSINVNEDFTLSDNVQFNLGGSADNFIVLGTSTIGEGVSGYLNFFNAAGIVRFEGPVIINNGATWDNDNVNDNVTFYNGITRIAGSTFISGTGNYNFNNNPQALVGDFTIGIVNINTITLTNTNSLTVNTTFAGSGGGTLLQGPGATLNIGVTGAHTAAINATTNPVNTVNYTRAGTQTVYSTNFSNLGLSGSGVKTLQTGTTTISRDLTLSGTVSTTTVVNLAIGGDLSVGNGTTINVVGFDLTVDGITTIGSGTSGTLNISTSTAGTKTFGGVVTINTGATWNNSANEAIVFQGGIANSSTVSAGSGLHTFNTNPQNLSGTLFIPNVFVDAITITNNGAVTVGTDLNLTGAWVQGIGSTLNLPGTISINSLSAAAAGNNVQYSGGNQEIFGTTYADLTINQSAGEATVGADLLVNETLTLTSRNLNLSGFDLEFGASSTAIAGGPFSSSKMIIATGGSEVRKIFGGAGSFSFPIGDNTGALEYSPVQLTSNGASSISVSVVDAKHPNNASTVNYLTRYWNVTSSAGITVDVTASYTNADITGTETLIKTAQLDGTFIRESNPWVKSTNLDAVNNEAEFSGAVLSPGQTSAFTGILGAGPVAAINIGAGTTICESESEALLASVSSGGDGPFTYLWSPATGLSATNIANPSASPTSDETYTVTVTDANGIIDTEVTTITVNPLPSAPSITFVVNTFCVNDAITAPFITTPIGGSTYQWYSNPGLTTLLVTSETPTNVQLGFDNTVANVTTVYVTETTTDGCRGPATPITLTVRAVPTAEAGAATADICDGQTTILGGSPSATGGAGSYTYSWSPATGLNNALIANPTFTSSGSVSQLYTLTVQDLNGCQDTDGITVNVTAAPVAPAVTFTPSTYCVGAAITPPTAVGTALQWWSNAALTIPIVVAIPTAPTAVELGFSTGSAGVTTVYVTQTVAGCRGAAAVVTLNVISGITASLVSNDADNSICQGTTTIFTATPIGSSNYNFILNGNFGSPVQSGVSNTYTTNALTDNDQLEVVVTGGGGCTDVSNAIVTNVDVLPVADAYEVDGTNSFSICGSLDYASDALSAIGTGTWSKVSGPAGALSFSVNANAADQTITFPSYGTYVLRWTDVNGACSDSDDVTINLSDFPTVSVAGAPQTVCGASTVLTANTPTIGTGTWTVDAGVGGSFVNVNDPGTTFNGIAGNSYTLRWTISNGVCAASSTTVVINLQQTPTTANAGADQAICNTSTILAGNSTIAIGTGAWTFAPSNIGTGGNILAPGTFNSGFTGTSGQTYVLRWTISNGVCTPSVDEVTITMNVVPDVQLTPSPQVICSGGATAITVTNPNTVPGTVFNWIVQSSSNVNGALAGSGTSINQVLTSNPVNAIGLVTYRVTPNAGACVGAFVDVTVTVNPVPNVSASNAVICSGATTSIALNNPNSVLGTGYRWTVVQSGVTGASDQATTVPGPIAQALSTTSSSPGTATYTITPVANGCFGTPTTVVVTVNPIPTVAASNQIICSGASTNVVISNPNTVLGTTYSWTQISTNVTGSADGSGGVISQLLTSTDGVTAGSVVYTITPAANGCSGLPINITVTVNPTPIVTNTPGSLSQLICSGETLNFNPTSSPVATINWTATATVEINPASISASGSGLINNTPINTSNVNGTVTYRLVPVVGGCTGNYRDYVVTVKPLPSVSSANVVICSGSPAQFTLSSAPKNVAGTTYSWVTSTTGIVTGQAIGDGSAINQVLTTDAVGGVVTYTITPSANGCAGPSVAYTATVNPKAIVNAGADFAVCEPASVAIAGTLGGSSTSGTWSVVPGLGFGSVTGSGLSDVYTVHPSDIGNTVTLRFTSNDPDLGGPCPIVSDDIVIAINRQAHVTAPADYTLCEPTDLTLTSTLTGSASGGSWALLDGDGTLTVSSITLNTLSADYIPALSDVTSTLHFVVTTNDPDGASGPCAVATDDLFVTINESAKVNAGLDFEVCEDEPMVLNGTKTGAPSVVTWTGGTGSFAAANNPVSGYTLSAAEFTALNQLITFRLTANDPDGAGPCTSVFDEVVATVNDTTQVIFFGLDPVYAENQPPVTLGSNPTGGVFTGPGITAGTNIFSPEFANVGSVNTIVYTYVNPITSCTSIFEASTIVNPVTNLSFRFEDNKGAVEVNQNLVTVCAETGDILLIGDPLVNTPPVAPINAFFSSTTPGIISQVGLNFYLRTNGLPGGSYFVTYTYTNEFNATNSLTREVYVYSAPTASIFVENACIEEVITFDATGSTVPNNLTGATIDQYLWEFDDNFTQSSAQNPTYAYANEGLYDVVLKVTTNQGCFDTAMQTLRVGRPPEVDFEWTKVCSGDLTEFENNTDPGISPIASIEWSFGDGSVNAIGAPASAVSTVDGLTTGTYENPIHAFTNPGAYSITQIVTSVDGCQSQATKNAFILTSSNAVALQAAGYRETFANGQGTWFPTNDKFENVASSSWLFGVPNGDEITPNSDNSWYMTSYNQNDTAYVIGPCLNLSGLVKPMVSLDFWVDTNPQLDGAVLQYSIDEGKTWSALGDNTGKGIDWYNSSTITGNPGQQQFNRYGWSGTSKAWINARYNLDEIPGTRDKVVIRLAFGSNNPSRLVEEDVNGVNVSRTLNGFAFDNIYIGEKQKLVLVENFANNGSPNSFLSNGIIDNAYDNEVSNTGASDFIKLQYHVANPGPDEFNLNNPADPSVRSFFYNVEEPPFAVMDGLLGNDYTVGEFNPSSPVDLVGVFAGFITREVIEREALKTPKFAMSLTLDPTNTNEEAIEYKIDLTYMDSLNTTFTDPVNVYAVLYESYVIAQEGSHTGDPFRNVVRQMLSGSGGKTINQTWTWGAGGGLSLPGQPTLVELKTQFVNSDSLYVIAFVQNKNTREIYQTVVQKVLNPKKSLVPVGVGDNLVKAELDAIQMYPNPASNEVNLFTEGVLSQAYTWKVITQQGVEVLNGNLSREFLEPLQIDTQSLADGVYFMVFGDEQRPLMYKKLVIVNRK